MYKRQGLKTGWTLQAGYCLVGFAERDGLKMVSVVMGNPVAKGHINDTKALFTWAFNAYIRYRPAPQELPEVRLQVYKGKTAIVRGSLPEDWGIPARKGQEISIHYGWRGPVEIEAPVEEGQFLGYVTITDESQEMCIRDSPGPAFPFSAFSFPQDRSPPPPGRRFPDAAASAYPAPAPLIPTSSALASSSPFPIPPVPAGDAPLFLTDARGSYEFIIPLVSDKAAKVCVHPSSI